MKTASFVLSGANDYTLVPYGHLSTFGEEDTQRVWMAKGVVKTIEIDAGVDCRITVYNYFGANNAPIQPKNYFDPTATAVIDTVSVSIPALEVSTLSNPPRREAVFQYTAAAGATRFESTIRCPSGIVIELDGAATQAALVTVSLDLFITGGALFSHASRLDTGNEPAF